MSDVRVLTADDQALVRAGFRKLLESEPGIPTRSTNSS
jgi:DNA-binding NarL/FixJ family response regulator